MTHRTAALVTLAGGAMVAIGSFLPWVSMVTAFGSIDLAGTSGDGVLTLVVGGVIALLAVINLDKPVSPFVQGLLFLGGLAATVFGIWEITNVTGALGDSEYVRASVGIGLYVLVAGGGAAVVGAMRMQRISRMGG